MNTDVFIGNTVAFVCTGEVGETLQELFGGNIADAAKMDALNKAGHLTGTALQKARLI